MRRGILCAVAVIALALPGSASAQAGGSWTLGGMLGTGRQAIAGQFGWPGVNFAYLAGLNDRVDVGGHFTFNYGFEGDPNAVAPGIKLAADIKLLLANTGRLIILLNMQPGFTGYFNINHLGGLAFYALSLPIELVLGLPVGSAFLVHFGLKMPMAFGLFAANGVSDFGFVFPIQPGVGIEYALDNKLSLTFDLRVGPMVIGGNGGSTTDPAFDALFGLTYRL